MRKVKIITVEGRGEVTVKEVSPLAVYRAWDEKDRLKAMNELVSDALSPSPYEIKGWYASEIGEVLKAFLEVNSSFFGIARTIKMDGLLDKMIKSVSETLPDAFVDSFKQAMATPGVTVGPSLS